MECINHSKADLTFGSSCQHIMVSTGLCACVFLFEIWCIFRLYCGCCSLGVVSVCFLNFEGSFFFILGLYVFCFVFLRN